MRYLFLIPLFIGLMLQSFSKHLILLEYRLNRDYIAQALCVNRDKPQMHCNGKCHLKKQLEKDDRQEQQGATGKEKYEVVYVNALQSISLAPVRKATTLIAFYQDPVLHTPFFSFFHPPQA